MSSPVRMEQRTKLSVKNKIIAFFCANVAFFLIKLPPKKLSEIIEKLSKNTSEAFPIEVESWRTSINSVNVRCAGNGCLQRSVAVMLWGIIARRTPDWVSGFQLAPFIAHAWVEIDGLPIGEEMDLSNFQKILFVKGEQG
ncbi:lasso peptide biosynthesis B2 protein [Streptococcus suis]|uniref:lasso peptide biosynthesis B2 protein n=1 Tax=Streptococcus suis TaxID=1307 RepID=UPI0038BD000C